MTPPALSVVIASVNGLPHVGRCLDALAHHAPEAEVIVADSTDAATRERLAAGWPGVRLLTFEEQQTVPELRAAGMFAAAGRYIAVIEDHCLVTREWAGAVVAAHERGYDVVGGPVHNVVTERTRDWAAFFCEYSAFMEPMASGEVEGLTGMNVSYSRPALDVIADLLREGRWENWLHPRLREHGFTLYCEPGMVIDHDKEFGVGEFLSQRWHYSRSYAGMRNETLGQKRYAYAVGTALLPPLLTWRIARNVMRRGRHRGELARSLPLILLYATTWAAGEAVGYVAGGGRSLLRVR